MAKKQNFIKSQYEEEFPKLSQVRSKDNDLEEFYKISCLSYSERLKNSYGEQETTAFNLWEKNIYHKDDQSFSTRAKDYEKCSSSKHKNKNYSNNSSETFNDNRRFKLFSKHSSENNYKSVLATGQNINKDLSLKNFNVCEDELIAPTEQKVDSISEQGWTVVRNKSALDNSMKNKSKGISEFALTNLQNSDLKRNRIREKVNALHQTQNESLTSTYVSSRRKITKSDERFSLKTRSSDKGKIVKRKDCNENLNLPQTSNVLNEARTENKNYMKRNQKELSRGDSNRTASKSVSSQNKILNKQDETNFFNKSQLQTGNKTKKNEKVTKQKNVNDSNISDNTQNLHISKQPNESYNVLEFNPCTGSKKRRKSKMKRQAAFQSDKLKIISSDIHMKILKLNNKGSVTQGQKPVTIDINDSNEYPELGACFSSKFKAETAPKIDVLQEVTDASSKDIPIAEKNDSSTDIVLSTEVPISNKVKDKDVPPVAKVIEQEKSAVHFNDPITISLFDILLANKSKKKEQEKAIEVTAVKVSSKSNKKQISAVNPLDSSKPAVKRGKERENPKPKKPSQLKKIILQDRKQKKERGKLLQSDGQKTTSDKDVETNLSSTDATSNESVNEFYGQSEADNCAFESSTQDDDDESKITLNENSSTCNTSDDKQSMQINAVKTKTTCKSIECNTDLISNLDACQKVEPEQITNEIESLSSINDLKNSFYSDNFDSAFDCQSTDCDTAAEVLEPSIEHSVIKNCDSSEDISCTSELLSGPTFDDTLFSFKLADMSIGVHNLDALNNSGTEAVSAIDINRAEDVKGMNINIDDKIIQEVILSKNQKFEFLKRCSSEDAVKAAVFALHSKKFREYCIHFLHKDLEDSVLALLSDLARFQDRMHQKDPVKARMKRRLLYGIREIKRHIKLKKLKCIIIATDIEDSRTEGGLNDMVNDLKSLARDNQVPCIFSLLRKKLGQVCHKPSHVSAVGILNYEGSETNFKRMLELQNDCKEDYFMVLKSFSSKLTDEEIELLIKTKTKELANLHNVTTSLLKKYFCETTKKETSSPNSDISNLSLIKDDSKQDVLEFKKNIHNILLKYKVVTF